MAQDWLNDDDYPDARDLERFGDDSPWDDDPLTIGYVGEKPPFWTRNRLIVAAVVALLLLVMFILPLLSR